ncbi:hypothetical protein BH10CYA1_BH10CYA1_44040 [soil metagenome]
MSSDEFASQIGFFGGYQIELTKKFKMSGEIQIPYGTCSPSSINKNGIYSVLLRRRHTYVSAERNCLTNKISQI